MSYSFSELNEGDQVTLEVANTTQPLRDTATVTVGTITHSKLGFYTPVTGNYFSSKEWVITDVVKKRHLPKPLPTKDGIYTPYALNHVNPFSYKLLVRRYGEWYWINPSVVPSSTARLDETAVRFYLDTMTPLYVKD